jgi:hypothetical protein
VSVSTTWLCFALLALLIVRSLTLQSFVVEVDGSNLSPVKPTKPNKVTVIRGEFKGKKGYVANLIDSSEGIIKLEDNEIKILKYVCFVPLFAFALFFVLFCLFVCLLLLLFLLLLLLFLLLLLVLLLLLLLL